MKKLVAKLFDHVERYSSYFLSFHLRPKHADKIATWSDENLDLPKMAIVVQGGLLLKDHFTLETVKLYKQLFPSTILIVSTWENEDAEECIAIEQAGAILLKNKKPTDVGQQNINLQLVSSRNGVLKAQELGAVYALKTRTDQRMYAPNAMEFLFHLSNTFPVVSGFVQEKRIVAISLNSFKYRNYGVSDMNIFGTIHDVLKYWSAPMDDVKNDTVGPSSIPKQLCEVYIATEFLKSVGRNIDWTLVDSWSAWKDHFVIADKEALDLYWYKYARMREYRYPQYDGIKNNQEMNFKEWLSIYATDKKAVLSLGKIKQILP